MSTYYNEVNNYIALIQRFANIPQEQIHKFIKSYFILNQSELLVDPSKPTNFFYDEEHGFTFIDLAIKSSNIINEYNLPRWSAKYVTMLLTPFLPTINLYQSGYRRKGIVEYLEGIFTTAQHQLISESFRRIISKLKIGFINNGLDEQEIDKILTDRTNNFEVLTQPSYNDEQEISVSMSNKLSAIISSNIQNNIISDEELSKTDSNPLDISFPKI